jgi:hypothetical protein
MTMETTVMEARKEQNISEPTRSWFKPGQSGNPAGRPKGSLSKFTPASLLKAIETTVGKPFVQSLAEGYKDSIDKGDTKLRYLYEKAILDKVVADRVSVEVDDGATMESKMEAFAAALNGFTLKPTVDTIPLDTMDPQWATVTDNSSEDSLYNSDQADQDRASDAE